MKNVVFHAGWALAVTLVALPARADCRKNTVELPVRLVEGRPITTVTLNGVDILMLGLSSPRRCGQRAEGLRRQPEAEGR